MQAEQAKGRDYALILCGKKAEAYFKFKQYKIDAAYNGFSEAPTYEDARRIAGSGSLKASATTGTSSRSRCSTFHRASATRTYSLMPPVAGAQIAHLGPDTALGTETEEMT